MKFYSNSFLMISMALCLLTSGTGIFAQRLQLTHDRPLFPVKIKQTEARKFDEYGKINPEDEMARLDNFAITLQAEPATTRGYIITYGGRRSIKGEAQKSGGKARTYLTKTRGITSARVIVIDGGYQEEALTELWIVPKNATPPAAQPSVDPSEVQFIKSSGKLKSTKVKSKPVKSKSIKKKPSK